MKLQAIIFDMDGVLVDSEPIHEETERMTLQTYNIQIPESAWPMFSGTTDKAMFKYIVEHFTDGSVSVEQLVAHRSDTYLHLASQKINMIKGALKFIMQTKDHELRIALVTSSNKMIQEMVFKKFNIGDYFDVIVTGDDITKGKPNPEPYLLAIEKLNVPASKSLVIEDSINGIRSAKAAGCIAVAITTSFSPSLLREAGADQVIKSFAELSHKLFP